MQIYLGKSMSQKFQLSAGNPNNDHMVDIKVVVKDTYGAESLPLYTQIKVNKSFLCVILPSAVL